MIKFRCGECDKKIGVPETAAGKRVKCPQCGQPARVPEPVASSEPSSSASMTAPAKPKAEKSEDDWLSDLAAAGEDVSPVQISPPAQTRSKSAASSTYSLSEPPSTKSKAKKAASEPAISVSPGATSRVAGAWLFGVLGLIPGILLWAIVAAVTDENVSVLSLLMAFGAAAGCVFGSGKSGLGIGILSGVITMFGIIVTEIVLRTAILPESWARGDDFDRWRMKFHFISVGLAAIAGWRGSFFEGDEKGAGGAMMVFKMLRAFRP